MKDHGVNYKSFTKSYLDSLGPFGDVIVSMLATIAAQYLIKISENTRAALVKKAANVQLGALTKVVQIRRFKADGLSSYAIGKALGILASTVAEYLAG